MGDISAGAKPVKGFARSDRFSFDRLVNRASEWVANTFLWERVIFRSERTQLETVLALMKTLEVRDPYTGGHGERISELAEKTARALHCNVMDQRNIRWAALLHDIGKVGVPDEILHRPGPLSDTEWAIMRRHPERGAEILRTVVNLTPVAALVIAHQEKIDGSGYPYGLKGDQIPLGARILAVVDAYSAMTDGRVYRTPRSHQEALNELLRCSGTDFDPDVVKAFIKIFG
jgi:putative nucleotidyltransferase with HDIG domain